jgi:hypothetical protein
MPVANGAPAALVRAAVGAVVRARVEKSKFSSAAIMRFQLRAETHAVGSRPQ